ncbi:MAG: hypothetical protein E6R04_08165 [Spirochaetes bacterium]|nr:MAG: hypothetical protein E6R04_08165 [Spirochaetota bacterium]
MAKKQSATNKAALETTKTEGKKKQIDVAQANEFVVCLFDYLYIFDVDKVLMNQLYEEAGKRIAKRNNKLMKKKIKSLK